jgi:hypothetical protein
MYLLGYGVIPIPAINTPDDVLRKLRSKGSHKRHLRLCISGFGVRNHG